jgi:hypothetical protein
MSNFSAVFIHPSLSLSHCYHLLNFLQLHDTTSYAYPKFEYFVHTSHPVRFSWYFLVHMDTRTRTGSGINQIRITNRAIPRTESMPVHMHGIIQTFVERD